MEDIIIKYLTGTISNKEHESLQDWLQSPKNIEQFKAMVRTNQKLDHIYSSINTDNAYQLVRKSTTHKENTITKGYRNIFKYAAIGLLFIGISISLHFILKTDRNININLITLELEDGTLKVLKENSYDEVLDKEGKIVAIVNGNKITYIKEDQINSKLTYDKLTVPYGKRFKLIMFDGTIVFINSGSKLRYQRSFTNIKSREVFLDGEAYFDVMKDKTSTFVVHTKNMDIRVLGTKFNVTSYQNQKKSSIVLEEGSVRVSKPLETFKEGESLTIFPGQEVIVEHEIFKITETNVEQHIVWIEGKLSFKNDRFEDIIKELERYYNIDIKNNSLDLNNIRFTGTFTTETISEVLNVFKESTQFEYKIEANKIIITSDLN